MSFPYSSKTRRSLLTNCKLTVKYAIDSIVYKSLQLWQTLPIEYPGYKEFFIVFAYIYMYIYIACIYIYIAYIYIYIYIDILIYCIYIVWHGLNA